MPQAGRDRDRVAGTDFADLVFDLYPTAAFEEVVNLLSLRMVMGGGGFA